MQGQVRWFNAVKRYGFITLSDGRDCFVHQHSVEDYRALRDGDRVEFVVETTAKGLAAVNVRVITQ